MDASQFTDEQNYESSSLLDMIDEAVDQDSRSLEAFQDLMGDDPEPWEEERIERKF